jgi:hypothetical protein
MNFALNCEIFIRVQKFWLDLIIIIICLKIRLIRVFKKFKKYFLLIINNNNNNKDFNYICPSLTDLNLRMKEFSTPLIFCFSLINSAELFKFDPFFLTIYNHINYNLSLFFFYLKTHLKKKHDENYLKYYP